MSINSNTFFNRIGILVYSTLISGMSAANRLRARGEPKVSEPTEAALPEVEEINEVSKSIPEKSQRITLTSLSQAFVALVIWMVMGFAAGFLVGMIRPW